MNGEKTDFWKDDWHEVGIMKNLFPDMHNVVLTQQSTIAELRTLQGWNFTFKRHLNDWEILRVIEFFNIIGQFGG